jgi:hypothetical protein
MMVGLFNGRSIGCWLEGVKFRRSGKSYWEGRWTYNSDPDHLYLHFPCVLKLNLFLSTGFLTIIHDLENYHVSAYMKL